MRPDTASSRGQPERMIADPTCCCTGRIFRPRGIVLCHRRRRSAVPRRHRRRAPMAPPLIVVEHDAVHLLEARTERMVEMRSPEVEGIAAEEAQARRATRMENATETGCGPRCAGRGAASRPRFRPRGGRGWRARGRRAPPSHGWSRQSRAVPCLRRLNMPRHCGCAGRDMHARGLWSDWAYTSSATDLLETCSNRRSDRRGLV